MRRELCFSQTSPFCSECDYGRHCFWAKVAILGSWLDKPNNTLDVKAKTKKQKTELGLLMTLLRCCLSPAKLTFRLFLNDYFVVNHFKLLIEFLTIFLLFYVFWGIFWPQGMWDLSSPTRDWIHITCIGRRSFNHWITKEVLGLLFKGYNFLNKLIGVFFL